MRIRTGFHLTLIAGGALVAFAILALVYIQSVTSEAVTRNRSLDLAFLESMQLVLLTNEVLFYGEERAIRRFLI